MDCIQPLNIVRGTTKTLVLTVRRASGEIFVIDASDTFRFAIKQKAEGNDTEYSVDFGLTEYDSTNQRYVLTLPPEATENLKIGRHFYDIGLQSGTDYYPVIAISPFDIIPNVSRRETE